ncbi:hypothetical protein AAEX63_08945 [Luteococcus sp. H138]|uniref:hypothetical protein n=1 Tax=unclassified Luteococcus TaxID=2639923 RepID=UPI00313C2DA0
MRKSTSLAVAVAAVGTVAISAAPAHAATVQRQCGNTVQMCLHYNSSNSGYGAEFGSQSNISSFNPSRNGGVSYLFMAGARGTSGSGYNVWNNAGSAANWSTTRGFRVYFNSGLSGTNDYIPPSVRSNLPLTKNQDASMGWA